MANATCKICGEKLDTKTAYKIIDKSGKNNYFCSQEEYENKIHNQIKAKEDKDSVYFLICDMFGYEIQNSAFFKEWALWNKLASNETIYKYIRENESYLQQVCDKEFGNEYQKIRYFSACIKNHLRDYKPKIEEKVIEKKIDNTFYDISNVMNKSKRRALDDLEDEI